MTMRKTSGKMILPSSVLWLICAVASLLSWQVNAAEIAHYTLRDGKGTKAVAEQNKLAPAKIRGSFWMTLDGCKLMDFGGMHSSKKASVEFPEINFTGEFSISIWVRAYWWNNNWAPIVFRSDATYGLRNNKNTPGQLHFRVKDKNTKRGANLMSDTVLERNRWYHVAAVFKPGKFMRLYINGRLDSEMVERIPQVLAVDKHKFRLGGTGKNNFYAGTLSDLHFFDHALTAEEVMQIYRKENRFGASVETAEEFPAKGKIAAAIGKNIAVYESGAIAIKSGNASFRLDSIYSYPATPVMGFNAFTAAPLKQGLEKKWQVSVKALDENSVAVSASGSKYTINRLITRLDSTRLRVKETIRNNSENDQGMVFFHRINPAQKVDTWNLYGQENTSSAGDSRMMPANPTLFIKNGDDALAMVAEDDIFRCHLNASVIDLKKGKKRFDFGCRFGIPAGKEHVLEYTVYTMQGDYFDFINRLRKDWKVPVLTLNGPYGLVRTAAQRSEVYRRHLADENMFRKAFERRNMKIITLNPWFNYWDGTVFANREEFKKHMQQVMKNIRKVNPEAKFLASLETYTYCLGEQDFSDKAEAGFSWTSVTDATLKRVMNSPWRDSATSGDGKAISLYPMNKVVGQKRPSLNLSVHPVRGNHFYKVRLEEFDFLLDEVGFDGIYQDMFGFSAPSYARGGSWDGFTVSLNPDGTISRKMTHLGPLSAPGRADWLRKIIGKGKIALTNFGAPTTRELQTIPYYNFCEAAGRGVGRQNLDVIPPDSSGCVMNQLSTPLAYGPHRSEEIDAVRLMARVRAYLRYGCMYIHTSFRNCFPEKGPKSGEYGPINHMYPITPIELHRGWVKGKERIVACVSYKTVWERQAKPVALRFDAVGRAIPVKDAVKISGTPGKWNIEVKIDDWKEFLILE